MNKDTLLATIIGLVLGLTITGIFLFSPNLFKMLPHINIPNLSFKPPSTATKKITPTPTPQPPQFTISSPLPDSIETNDQLVVSGVTKSNTTVVVAGGIDDDVTTSNSDGKYAGKITLTEGKNDISVTSYIDSKPTTQTVTVHYTQESL